MTIKTGVVVLPSKYKDWAERSWVLISLVGADVLRIGDATYRKSIYGDPSATAMDGAPEHSYAKNLEEKSVETTKETKIENVGIPVEKSTEYATSPIGGYVLDDTITAASGTREKQRLHRQKNPRESGTRRWREVGHLPERLVAWISLARVRPRTNPL